MAQMEMAVTWKVKVRAAGGLMLAEYACPDHGRIAELVERDEQGDPPGTRHCSAVIGWTSDADEVRCGHIAEYAISAPAVHTQFVVSATQGKSAPKPHRMSMDTRPLGEGQHFNAWKKERKKLWEEKRHERVKRLLE